jgi:hypothetical protein
MYPTKSVRWSFVPGLLGLALGGCAAPNDQGPPQWIKDPNYYALQGQTTYGDVPIVLVEVADKHEAQ